MNFLIHIGLSSFLYARARMRTHMRTTIVGISLIFVAIPAMTQNQPPATHDTPFIYGGDSRIHGIALDYSKEQATRSSMKISSSCKLIKKQPSALLLVGSEGASIDVQTHATRGVVVLEGLRTGLTPKILDTRFLSQLKNNPLSLRGETGMLPGSRYALAITLAATATGQGDLVFASGDSLIVHADGQLYVYPLPAITIPSEGILRVYLGTDDTLYLDPKLTHVLHAGPCGSKAK